MSQPVPPNPALAELAALLGTENIRPLVGTFLRDFPDSLRRLDSGDRKTRHRLAHGMKSSARVMGALALSRRLADLELRLDAKEGVDVTPDDCAAIAREFEEIAGPLRAFAEG